MSRQSTSASGRRLDEETAAVLETLEGRWALRLLAALNAGPARFSALEHAVPGVSRRMMTERLRELEAAGLVRRTVDPGPPITSTYELTPDGRGLGAILEQLRPWAAARSARAAS